jgi:hypothetical protein
MAKGVGRSGAQRVGARSAVPLFPPPTPPLMDPDAARALAVALLRGAVDDLGRPERRRDAVRWLEGWHAPLPVAAACELVGLDVDAVRERLKKTDHRPRAARRQ